MDYIFYYLITQMILFLIVVIKIFGTSYLSEKGKNVATKQDIEDITQKIEGVKIHYSTQVESVRATFLQSVNRNNHYLQKSSEILLSFYDSILILEHIALAKSFGGLVEDIVNYQRDTLNLYDKITLDYHRLLVFMKGNNALINSALSLANTSADLKKKFSKHIGAIKIALYNEKKAFDDMKGVDEAVTNTNNIVTEYYEDIFDKRTALQLEVKMFMRLLLIYLEKEDLIKKD
jgi:hypothetical protein